MCVLILKQLTTLPAIHKAVLLPAGQKAGPGAVFGGGVGVSHSDLVGPHSDVWFIDYAPTDQRVSQLKDTYRDK